MFAVMKYANIHLTLENIIIIVCSCSHCVCVCGGVNVGSLFCDVVSSCFFLFTNHHAEEERASCFSLCLGCMCSVTLPQYSGLVCSL